MPRVLRTDCGGEIYHVLNRANARVRIFDSNKDYDVFEEGRYKSFLCQADNYFIALARYVERNAKQAGLVKRAEGWKWSSVWRRTYGTAKQKKLLAAWPVELSDNS